MLPRVDFSMPAVVLGVLMIVILIAIAWYDKS